MRQYKYSNTAKEAAGTKPNIYPQTLHTQDGKVIAKVMTDERGRLFSKKSINSTRHQLRTPPAFAMDVSALQQARRLGVEYHQLFDRDTSQYFSAWDSDFVKHGFAVNRGNNPQVGLALAWWQKRPQPSDYGPGPEPPAMAVQLDLFIDDAEMRSAA